MLMSWYLIKHRDNFTFYLYLFSKCEVAELKGISSILGDIMDIYLR